MVSPAFSSLSFSRPAWAEINLSSLRANARLICGAQSTPLIAVIKANAYGHGAAEVARALLPSPPNPAAQRAPGQFLGEGELEVRAFAVASVDEGRALRLAGIEKPILLLSAILPEEAEAALQADLMPTLSTPEVAQALNHAAKAQNKIAKAHWKIDTGMGRLGTFYPHAAKFWRDLQEYSNLQIEGVYTHFACADDEDETFTLLQIAAFESTLEECGISSSKYLIHAANSAGAQRFPPAHWGAIRSGIALYGAPPMGNSMGNSASEKAFAPAMSLKARVTEIREISAGRTVSYGATWAAPRDSKIALVPLGYADGYSRELSNSGEVLLRSQRCPIVGRVTMDQIFVDVTKLTPNLQIGEIVTAWGRDEAGVLLPVEEVAAKAETISYELLCSVSPRIPRIYIS